MLAFREALVGFRRSPLLSFLSVTTIAFSLFAFGLFSLVALNLRQALDQVEERVEIRAFVADETTVEEIAAAMGDISAFPEVANVEYVSPEQALGRARRELAEFTDVFEGVELPASIEVRLKPGHRDPKSVATIAKRVEWFTFVEDVRYGEEWVGKLYQMRNVATLAGLALGLAFGTVAVIIIGATIRMTVLARSREISIMRLVGATDSFVRRPFLIEGFLKGVLGGVLALVLVGVANWLINKHLIRTVFFDELLIVVGLVGGATIGLLGSLVSVGRHLRRV